MFKLGGSTGCRFVCLEASPGGDAAATAPAPPVEMPPPVPVAAPPAESRAAAEPRDAEQKVWICPNTSGTSKVKT